MCSHAGVPKENVLDQSEVKYRNAVFPITQSPNTNLVTSSFTCTINVNHLDVSSPSVQNTRCGIWWNKRRENPHHAHPAMFTPQVPSYLWIISRNLSPSHTTVRQNQSTVKRTRLPNWRMAASHMSGIV